MNNLKKILEEKGITFYDIKALTGVKNLKAIQEGKDLKLSTAQKIAAALEVTVDELFPSNYRLGTMQVEKPVLLEV